MQPEKFVAKVESDFATACRTALYDAIPQGNPAVHVSWKSIVEHVGADMARQGFKMNGKWLRVRALLQSLPDIHRTPSVYTENYYRNSN